MTAKQQSDVVAMLLAHRSLTVERPDGIAWALAQFRANPRLSFTDCLVVEIARSARQLPVGTFDRALGRVEGAERLASRILRVAGGLHRASDRRVAPS